MIPSYKVQKSHPYPLGVRREGNVILASMVSETEDCGILLYSHAEETKEPLKIPFPADQRVGMVYSMSIQGIGAQYTGYRLYKGSEIFADEYGRRYKGYAYGSPIAKSAMMGLLTTSTRDLLDWDKDIRPHIAFSQAVFYGLHVRGFTFGKGSNCRYKGTFKGIIEKLDYLQDLGVTSILLMPAYEFIEREVLSSVPNKCKGQIAERISRQGSAQVFSQSSEQGGVQGSGQAYDSLGLNYWGYKKGFYYAPKSSYAAGDNPCLEMMELVRACHVRGMELLMQFYFPGDVSAVEAVRVLEYWVQEYHIDGFRISSENLDVNLIIQSPILADSKIICSDLSEDDAAKGFSKSVCVCREDTTKDFRRFLRGDEFSLDGFMYHFRKNSKNLAYLNNIADYQGFRLVDLVSYDYKHNELNGERNTDGSNYNYSWNCGIEGPTEEDEILKLRKQQIKNGLSLVLLSQGTPYLFMGDEMGQSQKGNNNPYNQDNEISWLDWSNLEKEREIYLFTKELIAYRRAHPILHMDQYLDGTDYLVCGYPNISFHGLEAYMPPAEPNRREIGVLLCGKYACDSSRKEDKLIYIACNMHGEQHTFELPRLYKGLSWHLAMSTTEHHDTVCLQQVTVKDGNTSGTVKGHWQVTVPARCIVVLEA